MPFPVPFQMKVGSFTVPTVLGGPGEPVPQVVSGVGFKPKAVVLLFGGNSSAGAWQGAATDADSTGVAVAMFTADDAGQAQGGASLYESSDDGGSAIRHGIHQRAIRFENAAGTVLGKATLTSMDDDGFTLAWDDDISQIGYIVGYIALGGDALVAKLVKWQLPAFVGTSEQSVTGVGFKPDVVLHMLGAVTLWDGTGATWPAGSFNDASNGSCFRLGAMDADGNQWALSGARMNGAAPTSALKTFHAARVLFGDTPAGVTPPVDSEFVSMDTDGFTLRHRLNSGNRGWVASLALGGINAKVGTITKRTSNGNQATTGIGFQPAGLILAGVHETGLPHAAAGDLQMALGAASSSSQRLAVSRVDKHNVTPASSLKRTETAKAFYGPDSEVSSADLVSFDADGWTLSWLTDAANADVVGYVALGTPAFGGNRFDMELNGVGGGWTNVNDDVLLDSPGPSIRYGISGTGPLDLTASTGTMSFALNNSEDNSAGKLGYYSPRHANCRAGFRLGIRIRYSYQIPGSPDGYGKFIGRLRDIEPMPGRYRDRKTSCTAVDWMNEAAITKYNAPTQVNQRADQVLSTIVALVPRQPDSTSFDVADSTFPYALDNGLVDKSTVMTEIQRICQSEYGRCYMRGGLNYWGRLRFEKRTARLTPSPVVTFNGTMQDLDSGSTTAKVKNKAKVTAHPRRVDTAATTVLFAKPSQNNPLVAPLATIRISGKYVDPSNPNARVGGTDMVAPVATTDYLMNANADGSGADRTANFTVVAGPPYGANQADFVITNTHATLPAFVTKLQIRGRGLYDYDPLEAEEENAASIALIGESVVSLDMPYQSDFSVTKAIAEFLVDTWSSHEWLGSGLPPAGSTPGVTEISIKRIPRTVDELTALMALEPGDSVVVSEDLAVVNDVYFLQSVGIKIAGDRTTFDFDLQRAFVQDYWTLGTAGLSELGDTTVLAPL